MQSKGSAELESAPTAKGSRHFISFTCTSLNLEKEILKICVCIDFLGANRDFQDICGFLSLH